METTKEKSGLEDYILQQSPALRKWLSPQEEIWIGFSSIFALLLFVIWSIRFVYGFVIWIGFLELYLIGILVSVRKSKYHSSTQESNDTQLITFIRSGVSWKRITDSLVGLAILSSILTYIFSNALPNNPEFASLISTATLIIHILIVPVIPALSKIKFLPIMKSKILIAYDGTTMTEVNLELHPLDYHPPDNFLQTE